MNILVRRADNSERTITVSTTDIIQELKKREGCEGVVWTRNGVILVDANKVSDYDMKDGDVLLESVRKIAATSFMRIGGNSIAARIQPWSSSDKDKSPLNNLGLF